MADSTIFLSDKETMFHDIIECLVAALEAKDLYTSGHSTRVADMSYDLAKKIGLQGIELEDVHIAAHLHDIGKIGVPEHVLNKKGALLPHEWEQIQRHPQIGYNILNKSRELETIAKIVLHHHERWDGMGYPGKLKAEEIPLGSRIIAICDTVDAMTSTRPYRCAFTFAETQKKICANKATQFDPVLVEAAEELWPDWKRRLSLEVLNKIQTITKEIS